jgi:hypothetical protein
MTLRRTRFTPTNTPSLVFGTALCLLVSVFFLLILSKHPHINDKLGLVSIYCFAFSLPTFMVTYRWPGVGSVGIGVLVCCCVVFAYLDGSLGLVIIPTGLLVIASILASLIYRNSSRTATTVIR